MAGTMATGLASMNTYLYTQAIDMRGGIDRLIAYVPDAKAGDFYIFCNNNKTRLKVLSIDQFGIWLSLRRLHQGHFIQSKLQQPQIQISEQEWHWLIAGLDWTKLRQNINVKLEI